MNSSQMRMICALSLAALLSYAVVCPRVLAQSPTRVNAKHHEKTSVILSTDVGNEIDDQWAIAYLLASPELNVLGIISAHAPSLPAPSAHSTYLVLRDEVENRLGLRDHVPLFEGSSLPLHDTHTPQPNSGTNLILDQSRNFGKENRLVILTIGAATDVASAILQDPTIVDRISILAMAFTNRSVSGGKEYNVENDVKAWQVLLNSDVPLTVGSGDVCRAYLALSFGQAKELISGHGPVGAWLWGEYQTWYYRTVKPLRVNDFSKPWIIWDIITLAYVKGMATGETLPRPRLEDDLSLRLATSGKTMTWITAVDSKRMWTDFVDQLDDFQRHHASGGVSGSDLVSLP